MARRAHAVLVVAWSAGKLHSSEVVQGWSGVLDLGEDFAAAFFALQPTMS